MSMAILLLIINIQNIPSSSINAQTVHKPLPVLLIHGYASGASVWNDWISFLDEDHIPYKVVTFPGGENNDACGSAKDHAKELIKIVNDFKSETGSPKINIVAHSKGGLDARVYLANNLSNANVANLIMIGTPNKGTPIADETAQGNPCTPAISDFTTNSTILHVSKNPNTNYDTIAGIWQPYFTFNPLNPLIPVDESGNCIDFSVFYPIMVNGHTQMGGQDDGLVPIGSAEPPQFHSLGETHKCHTNLLDENAYNLAFPVLIQ
jgi:pimeloyl-ACP methyl ester carboxylesterase